MEGKWPMKNDPNSIRLLRVYFSQMATDELEAQTAGSGPSATQFSLTPRR